VEGELTQVDGRWQLTVLVGARHGQVYRSNECPAWLQQSLVRSIKRELRRVIDEDSWVDRVQTVG